MDGARWVYDNDQLGAIRPDVMTILTDRAASRQGAMASLQSVDVGGWPSVCGQAVILTESVYVTLLSQCADTLQFGYSCATNGTDRFVRNLSSLAPSLVFTLGVMALQTAAAGQPHNVVLFVPDGLRALIVSDQTAPTMSAIRDNGVNFKNPHALFPTFTTPNAAAMATGHFPGDTGDFSNTIYSGFPVPGAGGSLTPFLESDPVLGDVDEHFAGDYPMK